VSVLIVADRSGGSRVADDLIQPLVQTSIDLVHEPVPVDDVESGDDAYVHRCDDH
jgi:hypothetical protein